VRTSLTKTRYGYIVPPLTTKKGKGYNLVIVVKAWRIVDVTIITGTPRARCQEWRETKSNTTQRHTKNRVERENKSV
jgi:hypothetical protein